MADDEANRGRVMVLALVKVGLGLRPMEMERGTRMPGRVWRAGRSGRQRRQWRTQKKGDY